ncbi:thiamine-phosphate pyrophosphorylase [Limimonas halophila]|uniref:Thiamine-phosphate pyrophosphorylase n=1 Tax=Limimonas halophila TaxID=1082479 RepID=A0A1G7LMP7_9PROT|nr:thiamine phosphate synthase [Limimonas halophila]SDF50644.1 thiamine-phosphate pyrophosphorylase [Limimonas halophila]
MSQAPDPRLYLIVPGTTPAEQLAAAVEAGDVACVLLTDAGRDARQLVEAAQARGVAVLVADDPTLARALGADGVHLNGEAPVKKTRDALGGDGIVGVQCGRSRHTAMVVGEAGADYVAFAGTEDAPDGPADPEALRWWQLMMTVPCVAMGGCTPDDAGRLAQAGADFVALGAGVWDDPEGPAAAVARAQAGLDTLI